MTFPGCEAAEELADIEPILHSRQDPWVACYPKGSDVLLWGGYFSKS